MTREQHLEQLKAGQTFDLLIIGGGATGCGVALDAATRGLKVALVEKNDFSEGHQQPQHQAGSRRRPLP